MSRYPPKVPKTVAKRFRINRLRPLASLLATG